MPLSTPAISPHWGLTGYAWFDNSFARIDPDNCAPPIPCASERAWMESGGNIGKLDADCWGMASSNCSPKMCILAIDDEASFLGFIKETLECLRYKVFVVSSPQEAIKFYEERWREIDVVLLDYWLPPMTGTFVFDELQRLNPDVRVVLVTGCHEPVAADLFKKGLRGFLRKPFNLTDLARTIQDAINSPAVPSSASPSLA